MKTFLIKHNKISFLLLLLFINSTSSLVRLIDKLDFTSASFIGILGASLLSMILFYLPIKRIFYLLSVIIFEAFFLFVHTFYDFCFFITGSDITKEALGNIGLFQLNAAFELWGIWCYIGILYYLVSIACVILLTLFYPAEKANKKQLQYLFPCIFLVAIWTFSHLPILSVLFHTRIINRNYTLKEYAESGIKYSPLNKDDITASPGKNIIRIYLESFDSRFLNEKNFPGLLPNLNQLAKEGLLFTNITNAPLAHYTFGGLYASIMGINAVPEHFSLAKGVHGGIRYQFGSQMPSLLSISKKAGYFQTFLNGPDINFAGMGPFLKREEIDEALSYKKTFNISAWTCSDAELFDWGYDKYEELLKKNRPFHLIILTLDTHAATGFPHSKMLKYDKLPGKREQILDLFHTTDFHLGKFIKRLKKSSGWKNTCVIITSDHTACWETMYPAFFQGTHSPSTHVALALNTGKSGVNNTPGMTFDMAPTALSLAGIKHNYIFPLGEDLTSRNILNRNRLQADSIHQDIVSFYMKFRNDHQWNKKLLSTVEVLTEPYFLLKLNDEIIFFPTLTVPQKKEFIYFDFLAERKINLCRTYSQEKVEPLKAIKKAPYYGVISKDKSILSNLFPDEQFEKNCWYLVLSKNGKNRVVSSEKIEHLKGYF